MKTETGYKKLKELQMLQSSIYILISKLIFELNEEKRISFYLPLSKKNKRNNKIYFHLKPFSKYTANLEISMQSPFAKRLLKLDLRIYHEAQLGEVVRFQNFHVSLLDIFQTNLKFGFQKDERLQWNSFAEEFLKLSIKEGRSVESFIPPRF